MSLAAPMPSFRSHWRHRLAIALCGCALLSCSGAIAEDSKQSDRQVSADQDNCGEDFPFLDWTGTVTQGEAGQRSERCRGSYLDPLQGLDTSRDPATEAIEANASRSEMEGDMVRLSGGVEARQGYRQLRAEDAEYNRETGLGTLLGDVELREPGLLMRGATGSFDSVNGEFRMTANQFVLHEEHIRGGADLIVRRPDGVITLDDGYYSYCPPLLNSWMLRAKDIEIDLEAGVATARDAKIEMGGVPVIYTPYLSLPIDDRRKSGFLWPDIGQDSNGGVDIAVPYYFNLAPNYDATLTPRLIQDRGLLTEVELRYLADNTGFWRVSGAWIGGDDEYQEEFPDEDGDRWLAAVEQRGLFNKRWRTTIDYTETSDEFYFSDIDTTSLEVTQSLALLQAAEVDYLGDNWVTSARLEDYQVIARDITQEPYSKLPQLSLLRSTRQSNFQPNLLWQSDYAYFDNADTATGHRLYNAVGVNYPMQALWGFLTPTVKYRQLNFDLDEDIIFNGDPEDTPDAGAPMFSLDGGLFFERETRWGTQTLEPRIYYLYSDYEEQNGLPAFDSSELTFTYGQLFRETRFSGLERIDDSNQVSVGITTRFINPRTGSETFTASLGQIYYFEDRRVTVGLPDDESTEGSSAIAAELSVLPNDNFSLRSSWLWNTNQDELDQSNIQIAYTGYRDAIFNLGFSFRRDGNLQGSGDDLEQVDFSTYFPINREWAVFFRSLYDLEDQERVNDMAGIEYNSCCWRTRLLYQRFQDQRPGNLAPTEIVEYENAIYLEFHFKGLGSVGTRVTDLLEEFIRGYEDSDI